MSTEEHDYLIYPLSFPTYKWFGPILTGVLTVLFYEVAREGINYVIYRSGDAGAALGHAFGAGASLSQSFDAGAALSRFFGSGAAPDQPVSGYYSLIDSMDPVVLIYTALPAAMLTVALFLASMIVKDRPFSSYSSVRGGFDLRMFLIDLALTLPVFIPFFIITVIVKQHDMVNHLSPSSLCIILLLVPLQCIGEEFIYRGFLAQTVASWSLNPRLGILVSSALFALVHPYDLTGTIQIFACGAILAYLACKTGGLEASCALHIANNICAFILAGLRVKPISSNITLPECIIGTGLYFTCACMILSALRLRKSKS